MQVDVGFALLALALVLPIVVFFVWYVVLEHCLLQQLMRHDYDEYRELNVEVRFQVRCRTLISMIDLLQSCGVALALHGKLVPRVIFSA